MEQSIYIALSVLFVFFSIGFFLLSIKYEKQDYWKKINFLFVFCFILSILMPILLGVWYMALLSFALIVLTVAFEQSIREQFEIT